jgi:hypothetical protein
MMQNFLYVVHFQLSSTHSKIYHTYPTPHPTTHTPTLSLSGHVTAVINMWLQLGPTQKMKGAISIYKWDITLLIMN